MSRSPKVDALMEALPYFQQFRGKTVVVKYGGAAMENPDLVESVLHDIVSSRPSASTPWSSMVEARRSPPPCARKT